MLTTSCSPWAYNVSYTRIWCQIFGCWVTTFPTQSSGPFHWSFDTVILDNAGGWVCSLMFCSLTSGEWNPFKNNFVGPSMDCHPRSAFRIIHQELPLGDTLSKQASFVLYGWLELSRSLPERSRNSSNIEFVAIMPSNPVRPVRLHEWSFISMSQSDGWNRVRAFGNSQKILDRIWIQGEILMMDAVRFWFLKRGNT